MLLNCDQQLVNLFDAIGVFLLLLGFMLKEPESHFKVAKKRFKIFSETKISLFQHLLTCFLFFNASFI